MKVRWCCLSFQVWPILHDRESIVAMQCGEDISITQNTTTLTLAATCMNELYIAWPMADNDGRGYLCGLETSASHAIHALWKAAPLRGMASGEF